MLQPASAGFLNTCCSLDSSHFACFYDSCSQSGGSTISAAMLTLGRRDVSCAVLGSGLLSVVDIEYAHRVRERLPAGGGDVRDPSWSPYRQIR